MKTWSILILIAGLLLTQLALAGQQDKALLEELRALADKSRQQQAADRWLQRALDELVARYDRPWQRTLLFEDFNDGDYTHKPAWKVVEGHFNVIRNQGLVARVDPDVDTRVDHPDDNGGHRVRPDLAGALVGAILDQAFGSKQEAGASESREAPLEPQTRRHAGPNRIRLHARVSNAFAITATLRANGQPTRFEIALLQDTGGRYGYRLRVDAGRQDRIELVRLRRGYESIVEQRHLTRTLSDGHLHDLAWRQAPDGTVSVLLDDKAVFQVRDRAFRDGYPWLELRQDAGELVLRSLRIEGT